MSFSKLKKQVQQQFNELTKETHLFQIEIDRDRIFEEYLNGFSLENRQSHNCNCCKSFLRQYSSIVKITANYKVVTMWDIDDKLIDDEYKQSVKNIREYIKSLPVTNVFLTKEYKLGTDKNFSEKHNCTFEHFSVDIPRTKFSVTGSLDTVLGDKRTTKQVFKRGLEELTIDAFETTIELINQNSLYRGKEFLAVVQEAYNLKKKYVALKNEQKDNFCWVNSQSNFTVSRIRNTAIGTLLINLSEGMELDAAVSAFERVVAPSNYKRPTSLVTPKMVEEAKKKLVELNLIDNLERKYATFTDLNINDVLFVDRSSELKDLFAGVANEKINPKSLSKIEEIGIEDFIKNVLPTSKSVEVLVENSHLNNFVSLITGEGKSPFKWKNNFSWSYTGGITDSIKERVKAAGGNVEGVLRFSIQWNDINQVSVDLDAHAFEPDGTKIAFNTHKGASSKTRMSGFLDVDMIRPKDVGVENITWTAISKMQEGVYKFYVHNYDSGRNDGVRCQIEMNGEIYEFNYDKHFTGTIAIAEVTYNKQTGFTIKSPLENTSKSISKLKWNITTNEFTKVKTICLSPNHWENEEKVGNKHYMFFLENCISDEAPRPFFNEFLTNELNEHRKVFEILASKIKVQEVTNPLNGLGFSETQKNHLIVRVEGNFKRTLKILF